MMATLHSSDQAALSKEELRLAFISHAENRFKAEVDEIVKAAQSQEDAGVADEVKVKFQQTFDNFLTTAFDLVFRQELLHCSSVEEEEEEPEAVIADEQDLSVNDAQLQEMDDAIRATCRRRKFHPAKCSLFLDKTLKLQLETETKIKTKVRTVKPLAFDGLDLEEGHDEAAAAEMTTKAVDWQKSQARRQMHKAAKVEKSAKMLKEYDAGEA